MTSFIYCVDKELKDELISKGYKLITTQQFNNQLTWVFENKPNLQFDIKDKTKYFASNTMRF